MLIVLLGGLAPLIRQMLSPNVEVQCNAVGCITNLATHEDNKAKIARSGALGPLTRLAKSKDMRVQRNATGALLNMTHSGIVHPSRSMHGWDGPLTSGMKMTIDNNSYTPEQFQSSYSSCHRKMWMSNITAPQP